MDVVNEMVPTSPECITEMMEPGPDAPIDMVNLLKFNEHAQHEDGRGTDLAGLAGHLRTPGCGSRWPAQHRDRRPTRFPGVTHCETVMLT